VKVMNRRAAASHSFEPHTGEVRLVLTAGTREALLAEAGRALAELMLRDEDRGIRPSGPASSFEVRARDGATLLAEWLNELIYRSETSKRVFTEFQVEGAGETWLRGRAWGVQPLELKTAVKAATLHGLSLTSEGGTWRATAVLDV
jgi:SHS2 domain-containing protein